MDDVTQGLSIPRKWLAVGALGAFLALGAGVAATRYLLGHGADLADVLSGRGARNSPIFVSVGSVTNHARTTGPALDAAAQEGVASALAERTEVTTAPPSSGAARGARVAARGHVLDANLQSITVAAGSTRVEVSIVVSSHPSRAYEFESTSTVTLVGTDATPDAVAMGVRRAMRSATMRAVDQMTRAGM
jgi:hypothetical protein